MISVSQLQQAEEEQRKNGTRLGSSLIKLGALQEDELLSFLSKQYRVPSINLDEFQVDPEVAKLLSPEIAKKHMVVPVHRAGASLVVAMADPSNILAVDEIKFLTNFNVEVVVAGEAQIERALERAYGSEAEATYDDVMQGFDETDIAFGDDEESVNVLDLEKSAEEAPVVRLVNLILVDAIKKGASDIHIEPYEKMFRVRMRIDGQLYEMMKPPLKLRNAVISRLKIMSAPATCGIRSISTCPPRPPRPWRWRG
jgi:type IV pilus assembly protein PilB